MFKVYLLWPCSLTLRITQAIQYHYIKLEKVIYVSSNKKLYFSKRLSTSEFCLWPLVRGVPDDGPQLSKGFVPKWNCLWDDTYVYDFFQILYTHYAIHMMGYIKSSAVLSRIANIGQNKYRQLIQPMQNRPHEVYREINFTWPKWELNSPLFDRGSSERTPLNPYTSIACNILFLSSAKLR